jgi:hypothetical protein
LVLFHFSVFDEGRLLRDKFEWNESTRSRIRNIHLRQFGEVVIVWWKKGLKQVSMVNEECLTFDDSFWNRCAYDVAELEVGIGIALNISAISSNKSNAGAMSLTDLLLFDDWFGRRCLVCC